MNRPKPERSRFVRRLVAARLKERFLRWLGIGTLMFLVGACAIVLTAFVWQWQVAAAFTVGILAMGLAFYLFVKLWPDEEVEDSVVTRSLEKVMQKPEPVEISPEEYRRQRAAAQKLIADKAAPMIAKAIRGILRQDEIEQRRRKR